MVVQGLITTARAVCTKWCVDHKRASGAVQQGHAQIEGRGEDLLFLFGGIFSVGTFWSERKFTHTRSYTTHAPSV
jgi:hypothetical protein